MKYIFSMITVTYSWAISLVCYYYKKVPSAGSLGQADFLARQITFKPYLPDGQGSNNIIN